jgi:uncharacterized DUF497 family protein
VDFEWNQAKAAMNLSRHAVSLHEAATVFGDPLSVTVSDPDHSIEEDRFIILGVSERGRLLMVAFTERDTAIRIISCRPLTPAERTRYEHGH